MKIIEKSKKSYGGAFDIADDQFFTRDDLIEASDYVIDEVEKSCPKCVLGGTWFEDGKWIVNIQSADGMEEYESSVKVDMRRIKSPSDLNKYAPEISKGIIKQLVDVQEDLGSEDKRMNESSSKYYVTTYIETSYSGPEEGGYTSYGWEAQSSKPFNSYEEAQAFQQEWLNGDEIIDDDGKGRIRAVNDYGDDYLVIIETDETRGTEHSPARSWAESELDVPYEKPFFDASGKRLPEDPEVTAKRDADRKALQQELEAALSDATNDEEAMNAWFDDKFTSIRMDNVNLFRDKILSLRKADGSTNEVMTTAYPGEGTYKEGPYWYYTKHGVGPGMLPKGYKVEKTVEDEDFGTYVALDQPLTAEEEKEYELIKKKPEMNESEYVPTDEYTLEKGDDITIWWRDPSWDKNAPCYASCTYTGRTRDGKYKFESNTYGHMFLVDATNNTVITPDGKEFPLDTRSGWTKIFNNGAVEESLELDVSLFDFDDEENTSWERVETKQVLDSDGFWTDYTWYTNGETHIFIFGDNDAYTPENSDPDWECETADEAQEWFDSYDGFADYEDTLLMDESMGRRDRTKFIRLATDGLVKKGYSKEEANDIAIKWADDIGDVYDSVEFEVNRRLDKAVSKDEYDTQYSDKKPLNEATGNFSYENRCVYVSDEDYEDGNVPATEERSIGGSRSFPQYPLVDYNDGLKCHRIVLTPGYYEGACIDYVEIDCDELMDEYGYICDNECDQIWYDKDTGMWVKNGYGSEPDENLTIEQAVQFIQQCLKDYPMITAEDIKNALEEEKADGYYRISAFLQDAELLDKIEKYYVELEVPKCNEIIDQIKKDYGYRELVTTARFSNGETFYSFTEDVDPSTLTDCPECGDISFNPKSGRCTKCSYRESLIADEHTDGEETMIEDWTHFEFKSGSNPYIAKDEKEKSRILKKYGNKAKEIKPNYYMIDDSEGDNEESLDEGVGSAKTFSQWFDEVEDSERKEFYPFDNYVKAFPNAECLRDATAEDIRNNAHKFYDVYDVDSSDREKAFNFASEELGLDYDVFYYAWLRETPISNKFNESKGTPNKNIQEKLSTSERVSLNDKDTISKLEKIIGPEELYGGAILKAIVDVDWSDMKMHGSDEASVEPKFTLRCLVSGDWGDEVGDAGEVVWDNKPRWIEFVVKDAYLICYFEKDGDDKYATADYPTAYSTHTFEEKLSWFLLDKTYEVVAYEVECFLTDNGEMNESKSIDESYDIFKTDDGEYYIIGDHYYFEPKGYPNMKFEVSIRDYRRAYNNRKLNKDDTDNLDESINVDSQDKEALKHIRDYRASKFDLSELHSKIEKIYGSKKDAVPRFAELDKMSDADIDKVLGEALTEDYRDMERISALATYLDVDEDSIHPVTYASNIFEVGDAEWAVLTEDEAERAAKEDIEDLYDDIGVDSFTPWFRDWIYDNAVDREWFEEALRESFENYVADIKDEDDRLQQEMDDAGVDTEEEFVDYLVRSAGDPIEYYVDNFGSADFREVCSRHNLIDIDAVAEKAIEEDGVAHFIATYDGEEVDLGDDLFAYRLN